MREDGVIYSKWSNPSAISHYAADDIDQIKKRTLSN